MKSQKGFSLVETLLLLVILGMIGGTGWYVFSSGKKTNETLDSASATKIVSPTKKGGQTQLTEYKNSELGIGMTYPKEWGEASLSKGSLVSPQRGNYHQLSFSKATNIDIDFVAGPYSSPLDGCVEDPVFVEDHQLKGKRASVIGWDKDNIKRYMDGQGFDGPTVHLENVKRGETGPGWTRISAKDKVLEYQDIVEAWQPSMETGCQITQEEAVEANKYRKFYHYAVNYSNSKIKGVNAHFDYRKGDDAKAREQLVVVLNSLKSN